MSYTFAEGLVNEVSAYLSANLPTKLDAIDTAIGDGIVLADPVDYLMRQPGGPKSILNWPSMFLLVPQGNVISWHEASAEQSYVLWLYLFARDIDKETLSKRLYRYARAIWETLVDHQFSTATWKMGIGSTPLIDYGPDFSVGSLSGGDVHLELTYTKLELET